MGTGKLIRDLERRVDAVVRKTRAELPEDLRRLAGQVPVFCEWEIADHWLEDGVAEDSMGLFSGPSLADPVDPDCLESPCITFFLAELWGYCAEDPATFEEEVRVTYLHEFGHYLGLEEDEMEERGLL